MQIGTETIRDILDHPLHQADIEKLLRGLNETEKAQLFYRIAELARRTSAIADIANRVSDSLSLDVLFPRREAALAAFTEGLSRYRRREWGNAARCFRDALAANPKDGPSRTYRERCEIFRSTPPAPDWDGVWTMQGKY